MEETREQQRLYFFFQGLIYLYVCLEILIYTSFFSLSLPTFILEIADTVSRIPLFTHLLYSKVFTVVLVVLVSLGGRPKRSMRPLSMWNTVGLMLMGLIFLMLAMGCYALFTSGRSLLISTAYGLFSFSGVVLMHLGLDNLSKSIRHSLREDLWNRENESFPQCTSKVKATYSVHFPMRFYYQGRRRRGWVNITNPFRGTMVIGTPGSGKTYSIIIPYMKQVMAMGFSCVIYDFKYPDLTEIAFNSYEKHKKGALKNHGFHVVNLGAPVQSVKVNPLAPAYIQTLPQAEETAEALIYALKKSDHTSGADQFFTQSAINMLAAVIYYLAQKDNGRESSFPSVLKMLQLDYEELFIQLQQQPDLLPLIAPFVSAYKKGAIDQLEGQLGTLRINLGRLATKEVYTVFSKDEVDLRINHPSSPSILVLASAPETQEINSACYSIVVNRLTKLMNRKGCLPSALIIDEVPTLYIHRMENLLATARSNKVAILLGLQELPQFRQQYGKLAAETICSVIANVISGQVQNKETLEWLERLFGKIIQVNKGINMDRNRHGQSASEHLDHAIPAARIAQLGSGEFSGRLSLDTTRGYPLFLGKMVVNKKY